MNLTMGLRGSGLTQERTAWAITIIHVKEKEIIENLRDGGEKISGYEQISNLRSVLGLACPLL